jgi:hypothetical protein
MEEMRSAYIILVGNLNISLLKSRRMCEINIQTDLKEIGHGLDLNGSK